MNEEIENQRAETDRQIQQLQASVDLLRNNVTRFVSLASDAAALLDQERRGHAATRDCGTDFCNAACLKHARLALSNPEWWRNKQFDWAWEIAGALRDLIGAEPPLEAIKRLLAEQAARVAELDKAREAIKRRDAMIEADNKEIYALNDQVNVLTTRVAVRRNATAAWASGRAELAAEIRSILGSGPVTYAPGTVALRILQAIDKATQHDD